MPYVETQDVQYIAHLARIRLKREQIDRLTKQLDEILDYVNQLKSVDTENVQSTSHVLPIKNVFREDTVRRSILKEEALGNAPSIQGDFFKVPKVIE